MACDPDAWLRPAIAHALGEPVAQCRGLPGGVGGDAYAVTLASGRRVFVKATPDAPPARVATEAAGLSWLAEAGAVRLPRVLAVHGGGARPPVAPPFVAMEFVPDGPRGPAFDETLGRSLAALHRAAPVHFGLDHDNFVGPLPQCNAPADHDTFADFYRARRLLPLTAALRERGVLSPATARDIERIADTLAARVPAEGPARLHGDLWSGNVMVGPAGEPVLVDPAAYGGHREIDLAMMRLFGGFGPRVFAAYDEVHPRAPGFAERVPLMQLYPLLVHVALFGRSYVGPLVAAVAAVR